MIGFLTAAVDDPAGARRSTRRSSASRGSALALFGLELTVGVSWAVTLDIGGEFAGSVSAVMNTLGNIGAAIAAAVTGYIVTTERLVSAPSWCWRRCALIAAHAVPADRRVAPALRARGGRRRMTRFHKGQSISQNVRRRRRYRRRRDRCWRRRRDDRGAPLPAADPVRGKTVFARCAGCHSLGPDRRQRHRSQSRRRRRTEGRIVADAIAIRPP